ncbi:HAD family hydrolase [Bradyrhizobium sp. 139]|uniref:HAD family hydrolase n=1 Tax=Bradyrhizobium sp. 139 TaxID=2782616 RepID=UPI001FFB3D86|nr:HAD family hydrolase [Bradyrhizobium sp. 139]MCK1739713.1 HAD family hydrolase [Bradyrhizobium sp. 139]
MDPGTLDLIIFDCDGVLVDSELLSCRCLSEVLAESGLELSVEQALEHFLGRSTAAIGQYYRERGDILPDEFLPQLKARVLKTFATSLQPIHGVGAVLSGLNTPFCVASSSDIDRVSLSLEVTDLASHFDSRLYTSQMVRHGKPAPDLFLYAAEKMEADPARTLVIEDSVSGVLAAKAAGMTVWGFVGGSHYRAHDGHAILSAAGADRVFAHMSDFWKDA